MPTHTMVRTYTDETGRNAITKTDSITDAAAINLDIAVGATVTNAEKDVPVFDVSRLKSLVLVCDVAVTVNTNHASGSSPDDIIVLAAGVPLFWNLAQAAGDSAVCPFSVDVTKLFLTTPGAAGTLKVRGIQAVA